MPHWELLAFSTEMRGDVRYREYTRSREKAERFGRIPRIDFTDSSHGIVFSAYEMRPGEVRQKTCHTLREYVNQHMRKKP